MGFWDRFKKENQTVTVSKYQMFTDEGNGFYAWNGNLYNSDIVRAAIRPKVRAFGKTIAKHIRNYENKLEVNPEEYMRFLLEEPNPYMTGQMMQEKLAIQLELNNNAFAYIARDTNNYPTEIYPITSSSVDAVKNGNGELFLRFTLKNGKTVTFRYTDIIHLRKDFNENEIFGDSPAPALTQLMEVINTTDQGFVKAIKNSNVIKWLLKFNQTLRPEDLKAATKQFTDDYLNIDNESGGAAATDAKMDATQVKPNDIMVDNKLMNETVKRVYAFFGTNEKIVHSSYDENGWVSYYETCVEPDIVQASGEYTRKLFSRAERSRGNRIMFESSNLAFASLKTKMDFVNNGIDRGYVNANEGRDVFGMAPIEGGEIYVRRLDMAPTEQTDEVEE